MRGQAGPILVCRNDASSSEACWQDSNQPKNRDLSRLSGLEIFFGIYRKHS